MRNFRAKIQPSLNRKTGALRGLKSATKLHDLPYLGEAHCPTSLSQRESVITLVSSLLSSSLSAQKSRVDLMSLFGV